MLAVIPASADTPPPFEYQTTIPGYHLGSGRGLEVDAEGNTYAIARYVGNEEQNHIVVLKLDAAGDPTWSTVIDGSDHDYATDLVLNGSGQLYVTGWTDSDDFPVTPDGMDGTLTGFRDVFLLKLSTADGSIEYGTLIGGDYTDMGYGITLDSDGNIWLTGSTGSTDFPTVDAYQDEPSAPLYVYTDAFIMKLNPAGDSILYSSYFGGYKDDYAEVIALDADGDIVLGGETNADDFPLANPIQTTPADIWIAKLSGDGQNLLFSTYHGGEDFDRLGGLAVDSYGDVYISGSTRSQTFPTTPGAYQEDFVGEVDGCEIPFGGDYNCEDVFVTKLATDGTGIIYSSYLGGSTIDEARDLAIDATGRAYLVGYTYSSDFPPDGIDTSGEIFLARFDPTGAVLDYVVTVNSGSSNAGHGVAVDSEGDVYLTGAWNVPADIYVGKLDQADEPNMAPMTPEIPAGVVSGETGTEYEFTTSAIDPNGDLVSYQYDWGNGAYSEWKGPYPSGESMSAMHTWGDGGVFDIRVMARDAEGMESAWSEPLTVEIVSIVCGDVDGSGAGPDVSDLVFLTTYMFQGGTAPSHMGACDVDGSGSGPDIGDLVYLVSYMYSGGPDLQCP